MPEAFPQSVIMALAAVNTKCPLLQDVCQEFSGRRKGRPQPGEKENPEVYAPGQALEIFALRLSLL